MHPPPLPNPSPCTPSRSPARHLVRRRHRSGRDVGHSNAKLTATHRQHHRVPGLGALSVDCTRSKTVGPRSHVDDAPPRSARSSRSRPLGAASGPNRECSYDVATRRERSASRTHRRGSRSDRNAPTPATTHLGTIATHRSKTAPRRSATARDRSTPATDRSTPATDRSTPATDRSTPATDRSHAGNGSKHAGNGWTYAGSGSKCDSNGPQYAREMPRAVPLAAR